MGISVARSAEDMSSTGMFVEGQELPHFLPVTSKGFHEHWWFLFIQVRGKTLVDRQGKISHLFC